MIPIGEKLSSRPFRISDSRPTSPFSAHFPREEKKRDTQRDTPRPTSPVPPGPLTTYHNPIRSRRQSPQPSSAPRLSAIPPERPRTYRTDAYLCHYRYRSSVAPNSEYCSFIQHHCPLLYLADTPNRSMGKFPPDDRARATSARNQIRLPTFVGCTTHALTKSALTSALTTTS